MADHHSLMFYKVDCYYTDKYPPTTFHLKIVNILSVCICIHITQYIIVMYLFTIVASPGNIRLKRSVGSRKIKSTRIILSPEGNATSILETCEPGLMTFFS